MKVLLIILQPVHFVHRAVLVIDNFDVVVPVMAPN